MSDAEVGKRALVEMTAHLLAHRDGEPDATAKIVAEEMVENAVMSGMVHLLKA